MRKHNEKKKELEMTLSEIVKKIHALPDDPYCVELVESDYALILFGFMTTCDDGHIHVGFHLATPTRFISELAMSLIEYKSLLIFETVPVFISQDDAGEEQYFEDERAFVEYGKTLIAAHCCADCAAELFPEETNNKNKLLN